MLIRERDMNSSIASYLLQFRTLFTNTSFNGKIRNQIQFSRDQKALKWSNIYTSTYPQLLRFLN